MSGGVNSSVTAALLAERGFEVVGITLQLYDHGAALGRKGACCAGRDIDDAAAVARRLGIAHYVLDYESRFRAAVIEDFAESYRRGETPVPCIRCNQRIKFRDLLATAKDLGAAALATGHYVRRVAGPAGPELHRARDGARDQSYFLFATTRAELEFLRFPLGGLAKDETRALARRFGLMVADKPDSQDICFVPQGSYAGLVEMLRPEAAEPGDIVDRAGRVLGHHRGIAHFTVGQRKGLGVAAAEPLFVLAIEAERAPGRGRAPRGTGRNPGPAHRAQLAGARSAGRGRHGARGPAAFGPAASGGDALPGCGARCRRARFRRADAGRGAGPGRGSLRWRAGARRRLDPAARADPGGLPRLDPHRPISYIRPARGGIAQLVRAGES